MNVLRDKTHEERLQTAADKVSAGSKDVQVLLYCDCRAIRYYGLLQLAAAGAGVHGETGCQECELYKLKG